MTLTLTAPAPLTEAEQREVLAIVRAGLGAAPVGRHWSSRVYDALEEWCNQVEEALDAGVDPVPMPVPAPSGSAPPPPAPPTPGPARGTARPNVAPPRPSRPTRPGQLFCPDHPTRSGRGAWLPISAFAERADRPGKHRPWCRECTRGYAAAKYLSTATLRALMEDGLRVRDLPRHSPLLAKPCPACDAAWEPDDVVQGGTVIFHQECLCHD